MMPSNRPIDRARWPSRGVPASPTPAVRGRLARWSLALVLAVAGTLPVPTVAHAAWQEIVGGPSPINHSPTGYPNNPGIADVGGKLYVAWDEYEGADLDVHVATLDDTGTQWVEVGGPLDPHGWAPRLGPSIASIGGVPWVTWTEEDGTSDKVRVARLNDTGTGWTEVVGGAEPGQPRRNERRCPGLAGSAACRIVWVESPEVRSVADPGQPSERCGHGVDRGGGQDHPINRIRPPRPGRRAYRPRSWRAVGRAWRRLRQPKITSPDSTTREPRGPRSAPAPLRSATIQRSTPTPEPDGDRGVPWVAWREADDPPSRSGSRGSTTPGTGWTEVIGGEQPIAGSAENRA